MKRLICRFSEAAKADLLDISNEMLTTVMVLINQHNLTRELQRDYAWIVSLQRNLLKEPTSPLTKQRSYFTAYQPLACWLRS